MKKIPGLTTGMSETEMVNDFMKALKHPMLETIKYLRKFILSIEPTIGEEIFWNAPTFYYTGDMQPFDPKEYKRYIVGFNLYKQDTIRLIFLNGADVSDSKGILEGDYKNGRRLVSIKGIDDLKSKEAELKNIVKQLLKLMN